MAENLPKPRRPWRQNVKKETTVAPSQHNFSEDLKMNPTIVGYYSINHNFKYLGDASRLKYIRHAPIHELPFDLNEKFINVGEFDRDQMFFYLLTFLKKNKEVLRVVRPQLLKDAPFVCNKTTLTQFLQSEELMISACLSNNVIYVSADTEIGSISEWHLTNRQKAAGWGLKFQQFMQTKEPGGEIDTEKLAFGIERFLCVFQSQLGEHTIIYSGTVDGIRLRGKAPVKDKGDKSSVLEMLNGADLVDLHTTIDSRGPNKINSFSIHKTRKFWSQAYLAGLNNIVIGHRDKFGELLAVEESSPAEMHRAANKCWSPENCVKLCNRTLSGIKKALVEKAASMSLKHDLEPGKVPNIEMFFRRQGENLVQVSSGIKDFPNIHCDQLI